MALMPDEERAIATQDYMRLNDEESAGLKSHFRDVINAADAFIDANSAAFNSSIPQPARGILSTRQKAFGYVMALNRRFKLGL